MNRGWKPESHISVSDDSVVIAVELAGIEMASLVIIVEAGQLRIRGLHADFGAFDSRIDVPSGYSLKDAKGGITNGTLRIELPRGSDELRSKPKMMIKQPIHITLPSQYYPLGSKPQAMMIYCNECGKHFDIVVAGKGPQKYRCPACGKIQVFDLEALVNKAIEQSNKMLRRRRGGRGI